MLTRVTHNFAGKPDWIRKLHRFGVRAKIWTFVFCRFLIPLAFLVVSVTWRYGIADYRRLPARSHIELWGKVTDFPSQSLE
jgi:hypothetical protein